MIHPDSSETFRDGWKSMMLVIICSAASRGCCHGLRRRNSRPAPMEKRGPEGCDDG